MLTSYIQRNQLLIFLFSYLIHFLSEMGLTSEVILATFYKQQNEKLSSVYNIDFKFSNMQSVLLTICCMYFVIGSVFEYTRHSNKIVCGLCVFFGLLKTWVLENLITFKL